MGINLKSSITGFKVLTGGHMFNLAILLTILIAVRIPEYPEDPKRSKNAKYLYIFLVGYHLFMGLMNYCTLY